MLEISRIQMHSGDLAAFLSDTLKVRSGTVLDHAKALRGAKLIQKKGRGPRSAAHMGDSDAINWLLALVLEKNRGDDVAASVQRFRDLPAENLPPLAVPRNFADGLGCFSATTAGAALDGILSDLRSGRIDTWAAGERWQLTVTIAARGDSLFLSLSKPDQRFENDIRSAMHMFNRPEWHTRDQTVERTISIREEWFQKLAIALGPIG
jgi:hypothetical protein